jgi:predicted nucleic acid-binding protein
MKIMEALAGISRIFLDTAPVIYLVEAHVDFGARSRAVFAHMDESGIQGITSPVTLAECLIMPIRLQQESRQASFRNLLTGTDGISLVEIDATIGSKAAELRVNYGLKLPDALQIATAIEAGCDAFLTNDRMLSRVMELQVIVLGDLDV